MQTVHPFGVQARLALLSRRGAAMAEYSLLAALIAIVVAVTVTTFGTSVRAKFLAIVAGI